MRFSGKKIVITGAAQGLGQVIATSYAREGADIAILDRADASETLQKIREVGRQAAMFQVDVRNAEAVKSAVKGAADFLGGRIDVLVNNAGFNGYYNLVENMPLEQWRETLDINLSGVMLVTQAVIPVMRAGGGGSIGITASNVARRGLPYRADYVCSKWALLGLNQTLALELVKDNIRVNAICPGPVEGDRIEEVLTRQAAAEGRNPGDMRKIWEKAAPMNRFVTAEEVTAAMMFLTSDDASAMTGQALNVTGGFLMT